MYLKITLITLTINIHQLCLAAIYKEQDNTLNKCNEVNSKLNTYCSTFKTTPGNFGVRCSNSRCKNSCCSHTITCSKSHNYPDKNFLECVKRRVFLDFNDCCKSSFITPQFKYLYAGIAIAIMVSICGACCALTVRDDKNKAKINKNAEKMPYLHVNHLIATDQIDIFWDDLA